MTLESIMEAEKTLLLRTYDRTPLLFVSGDSVYLHDEHGNKFLDLLSGIGVSALGYSHPAIEQAIVAQSKQLIHTSNLFYNTQTAELALRLTEITGLARVFMCNSGAEAWEAALKLARASARQNCAQGSMLGTKFLALEHSFHGRTMGSVATTYKERYRLPFAPVMPDVEFVHFNDVFDLRAKFSNQVCGICIEPIQGEGGIHQVSHEFFATARELCDKTGALLIADEIQCGFGRTGKWCAYQHFGILPDVTTLAKPLAGGLPIGAMLANEKAARTMTPGMHGTTFGGGPLVCAVAIAIIDEIKSTHLLDRVQEVGSYFVEQLQKLAAKYDCIRDVRGRGLMIGIELTSEELAKSIVSEMLDQRIIVNRTSETVVRFLPPYILEQDHVDVAIRTLGSILTSHAAYAGQAALGESHYG